MKLARISWLTAAVAAFVLSTQVVASTAHAQTATAQVDTMGKGTIGLGLIGAELGFVVPALIGVDDTWAYVVFPSVGAAGGALAGYFLIDQDGTNQEIGVALLATGMALVIPSMVLTLSETAYDPADDLDEHSTIDGGEEAAAAAEDYEVGGDAPQNDAVQAPATDEANPPATTEPAPTDATPPAAAPAPEATPAAPGARLNHRRSPRRANVAAAGTGLLRVNARGWFVGMPAVTTMPTYSLEEMRRLGLSSRDQRAEVHVNLFSATF